MRVHEGIAVRLTLTLARLCRRRHVPVQGPCVLRGIFVVAALIRKVLPDFLPDSRRGFVAVGIVAASPIIIAVVCAWRWWRKTGRASIVDLVSVDLNVIWIILSKLSRISMMPYRRRS